MAGQPTGGTQTEVRVGPLLRYVDGTSATVWVETTQPCEVSVLGHVQKTFTVAGHHYALVVVRGLEPGSRQAYDVRLDGHRAWPPSSWDWPPPSIATRSPDRRQQIAFGSCRLAGPREVPLGIDRILARFDPDLDALAAFAEQLRTSEVTERPDLLLLLGDQVYADDVPRATARAMADRRGSSPEATSVADFEDYTQLYHDSWTEPAVRWLLSTVPSAMIFDDHELVDDWDISAAWVEEKRATSGWEERLCGALMSYWIYQHIGNLAPDELEADDLYTGVTAGDGDATKRLRDFVREYDRDHAGSRWAYRRDLGEDRLIVVDSRATRVLGEGRRDMLDPAEWDWLEDNVAGARHLLIATSVPVVYALGIHHLQSWSERVAAGAWGGRMAALTERLRRVLSLSGWPAFFASFERLQALIGSVGSGRRGAAPTSITILSGDIHHGYVARLTWPREEGVRSPVHQVVTSPFRNPLMPHQRLAQRAAATRIAGWALGFLARLAGVTPTRLRWRRLEGVDFANQISIIELDERGLTLHSQAARPQSRTGRRQLRGHGRLRTLWRRRLA